MSGWVTAGVLYLCGIAMAMERVGGMIDRREIEEAPSEWHYFAHVLLWPLGALYGLFTLLRGAP